MTYDPLYVQFLYYFNVARDYFECHEVMEELWLEEGRSPLYQGLLQVAVGLHHHSYGNVSGSIKLFVGGIEKLEGYQDARIGIDLKDLLRKAREYVDRLIHEESDLVDYAPFDIVITDPDLAEAVHRLIENPPVAGHDD